MTRPTQKVSAHQTVRLGGLVDYSRVYDAMREITKHRADPRVRSITLAISCGSGLATPACELHEFLWDLRGASGVPVRGAVQGLCGSTATLVLLGMEERLCTDKAMFALRRPHPDFNRSAFGPCDGSDEAVSTAKHDEQVPGRRFSALYARALDKAPIEIDRLLDFSHASGTCYSAEEALKHGLVTAIVGDVRMIDSHALAA